jgi:hypothetical protein
MLQPEVFTITSLKGFQTLQALNARALLFTTPFALQVIALIVFFVSQIQPAAACPGKMMTLWF